MVVAQRVWPACNTLDTGDRDLLEAPYLRCTWFCEFHNNWDAILSSHGKARCT